MNGRQADNETEDTLQTLLLGILGLQLLSCLVGLSHWLLLYIFWAIRPQITAYRLYSF